MRRRLLALLASLVLVIALVPSAAFAAGTNYAALGDSIAYGYGATNYYGYVYLFRDYLAKSTTVSLQNKAIPGIKSGGLLNQLQVDLLTRSAVKNAQVITISIGGNNLLGCASSNYSVIDTTCAASGVSAFQSDWPKILYQIRTSIGSKAAIYVMTLYNPYMGNEANYAVADPYVKQINGAIQSSTNITTYNYKVADVYTDFLGQNPDGSWKVCSWTHFCEATRDPHPTNAGHQEINLKHQAIYP